MKVEILCKKCEAGKHLREVTEAKLAKLDKYFGESDVDVKVTFKKESYLETTEVALTYAGKFVRASATSENFYDTLDKVLPKLEGQIRKYRTRFDQNSKNAAYTAAAEYLTEEVKDKAVVKEKQFKLTPMTVKEATEEMELLGHNFYVFLEAKTNTVQVLYLRNDGDLGLIEPKI